MTLSLTNLLEEIETLKVKSFAIQWRWSNLSSTTKGCSVSQIWTLTTGAEEAKIKVPWRGHTQDPGSCDTWHRVDSPLATILRGVYITASPSGKATRWVPLTWWDVKWLFPYSDIWWWSAVVKTWTRNTQTPGPRIPTLLHDPLPKVE